MMMKSKRAYVMRARAQSAEATRQRVRDAAVEELWGRSVDSVRLDRVARRAGVTVQTVLRAYSTKSRLVEAAWEVARQRIRAQRESAAPGDVDGTLRALVEHYEDFGDFVIRVLADEHRLPKMEGWLNVGRRFHRESMARQFSPWLRRRRGSARREMLDCLVAVCDVYTWHLFRRQMGRNRRLTEALIGALVHGILRGA